MFLHDQEENRMSKIEWLGILVFVITCPIYVISILGPILIAVENPLPQHFVMSGIAIILYVLFFYFYSQVDQ